MKRAFFCLLLPAILLVSSPHLFAQDAYRTNFSAKAAQWTNAANWQRFDSLKKTWIAADHFPTYLDGVITIQAGDSIQIFGAGSSLLTIDQVIVNAGGVLVFNHNQPGYIILNDGDGDDITVNGKMYVETDGVLRGTGKIQVNDGALFTVRSTGHITAAINNNGKMYWGANGQTAGVFSGCHIVNNDSCTWIGGNTFMDSATTFINNGMMWINATAGNLVCANNNALPAKIINKGTIINTGRDHTVDFHVKVDNSGTIGGVGTFLFSGGVNSAGILSPGASPGHLTVGPGSLRSSSINIEIATNGAIAGVNYDQLTVHSLQDLAGTTINVTDVADDSVNTEYTIINAVTVTPGKPYPIIMINAPGNLSASFKGNKLVLTKISAHALPVSWGGFRAVVKGNKVVLEWSTAMNKQTAHFVVEHSINGISYTPLTNITAQHGDSGLAQYGYTFSGADMLKTNYFRVKQVNTNGRSGYSIPRSVRFDKGVVVPLETVVDLANNELQFNVQTENLWVHLNDQDGKSLQQFAFQPGQHDVFIDSLPAGMYRVNIFVKDVMVEAKQFVKQ
jgi:FlaG/FlaF family flagellin (archaellin)